MNNPETTYDWQQPYTAAIWETDNLPMEGRIYEALSAVEERRLSPVEVGSDEDRALNGGRHRTSKSRYGENRKICLKFVLSCPAISS
jgi:hypothetical protein